MSANEANEEPFFSHPMVGEPMSLSDSQSLTGTKTREATTVPHLEIYLRDRNAFCQSWQKVFVVKPKVPLLWWINLSGLTSNENF